MNQQNHYPGRVRIDIPAFNDFRNVVGWTSQKQIAKDCDLSEQTINRMYDQGWVSRRSYASILNGIRDRAKAQNVDAPHIELPEDSKTPNSNLTSEVNDDSESVLLSVAIRATEIEIIIDHDIENFTSKDRDEALQHVREVLSSNKLPMAVKYRRSSVRMTILVTESEAQELVSAIQSEKLSHTRIRGAYIPKQTAQATAKAHLPSIESTDLSRLFQDDRAKFLQEIDEQRNDLLLAVLKSSKGELTLGEAIDVLQDTYEDILRMNPRDDIEDIKSYVFRIARNKAAKAVAGTRKQKSLEELMDELIEHQPSELNNHERAQQVVEHVRANLPEDPDLIAVFENTISRDRKTRKQLAEALGLTERKVKRLREKLGELVSNLPPPPS